MGRRLQQKLLGGVIAGAVTYGCLSAFGIGAGPEPLIIAAFVFVVSAPCTAGVRGEPRANLLLAVPASIVLAIDLVWVGLIYAASR